MREMVLNHASVLVPGSDRQSISAWLTDVTSGMGQLVRDKVVQGSLRMTRGFPDTPCLPGYSLFDALYGLRTPESRDEFVFLMQLATKAPLLSEVGEDVEDRFRACEHRTLPAGDGEPLVFCAITDGIAIGFPSAPEWDCDRITVHFDELLPDATIGPASEEIDQLTRSAHADPVCERHRDRLRAEIGPLALWKDRGTIFPNLLFGPDVRDHLLNNSNQLRTIVRKLVDLDRSAGDWQSTRGTVPPWRTKVSPESIQTMAHPGLRERRRFRSHRGTREMFEWHARFGNSGRIHLRFDRGSLEVEIGYIGPHLPL